MLLLFNGAASTPTTPTPPSEAITYVSQTDIESYLGITLTGNGRKLFNLLNPLLQDQIDNYCNRTWNFTNPVVETFDAMTLNGSIFLANYDFFPACPRVSLTPA